MNVGNTVFSQLVSLIPDYELRKCVDRYRGDFHARRCTCRDQFLVMSYAQFTSSASLRSIEAQLTAFNSKLYHAGLKIIPKSTLTDMNEKKDWRIYQDYAMLLAFEFVEQICSTLELSGPCDMDFFMKDGEYYLSEINPRFGGAYLHAYGAGVDFIQLILNNIDGKENKSLIGSYDEDILMMMYDAVVIRKKTDLLEGNFSLL